MDNVWNGSQRVLNAIKREAKGLLAALAVAWVYHSRRGYTFGVSEIIVILYIFGLVAAFMQNGPGLRNRTGYITWTTECEKRFLQIFMTTITAVSCNDGLPPFKATIPNTVFLFRGFYNVVLMLYFAIAVQTYN